MVDGLKSVIAYTDGAYSSLRKQGGVGIVFLIGDKMFKYSKMFKTNSNNKMELLAVIIALHAISKKVSSIKIVSDSQYVIGTVNNNWKRQKNVMLWKLFDKAYEKAKTFSDDISFEWVQGHSDNKYNNFADKLATEASQEIEL